MSHSNQAARLRATAGALFIAGVLTACGGGGSGGGQTENGAAATGGSTLTAPAGAKVITFIHLNDLHAHLVAHSERVADGRGGTRIEERGGLARTATLVKRIRAENRDSLLMDIGDTYHGGAEAWFTLGNAIVPPVNTLGVDVGVPGNWDFGYGSTVFRLRYTDAPGADILAAADPLRPTFDKILRPNFPTLAANMTYTATGRNVLPATLIKEVDGIKVGFIGITSDIVKFVYELLAPDFTFTGENLNAAQAKAAYRDLIDRHAAALRAAGASIVVVMSELGIHKDHALADVVAQGAVDVFFSAHTHETTFEPLTSASGALVVESGDDSYLGRMDLTVRDGRVTAHDWHLLAIDRSLPEDPQVQQLVNVARAPFMAVNVHIDDPMPNSSLALVKPLDAVIGHVSASLDRRSALESSFNNAMSDVLRHYGNTDLAMTPGFRFDSVVAVDEIAEDNTLITGDVTVEDAYRFFPMMFTVATGKVTGARLREILESSLTNTFAQKAFEQRGGWLEGWSGLSLLVDLSKPDGQRVVEMRLKDTGELIGDARVLTVTGCKRPIEPRDMLCRHSGFTQVQPMVKTGLVLGEPWTVLDLFIEAISTQVPFDATRRDITDLAATPLWPQATFIQPLTTD